MPQGARRTGRARLVTVRALRQKMAEDFARLKAWRAQSGTEGQEGSGGRRLG